MEQYLIDAGQLALLKRAAQRLYTENRMNGDEMRDLAHELSAIIRVCEQLEVPDAPRG